MPEGGTLLWKVQNLNVAPSLSYKNIQKPLKAPRGKAWHFDSARNEWSIVDAAPVPKGENVNCMEHHIMPSDTFQGICLKYKVTPMELRRANGGFTGENLSLAPNPLKIPQGGPIVVAKLLSQDDLIGVLLRGFRGISRNEAKAYLMMNDWDLAGAFDNAREDGEFS